MASHLKIYLKIAVLATTMLLGACGTAEGLESFKSHPLTAAGLDNAAAAAAADMKKAARVSQGDEKAEIKALITAVAIRHGIEPTDFLRMAQIESRFDPKAFHPKSKACGIFQFIPSTARLYGLADCRNPQANADAAAALWLDNAAGLRKALSREPSAGELYLAHQQGLGGAIRLLANPDRPAHAIVGCRAVTLNGGNLGMTAREFAHLWIRKFG
ncbi:transglycosylase SLT domain-containing protein [Rhizobium leguminosarum]|uniref:transglycosylase SLT domain-containing protein n=1 Tax=Rhizobium leguminosarum TaxID=384 RepID=UPI003F99BB5F